MKIGYDGKRFFHNRRGLGNYSRDLIRIMSQFYPDNDYFVYNPKPGNISTTLNPNTQEVLPSTSFWRFLSFIWRQKPILKQLQRQELDLYHGLTGEIPIGIHKSKIKTIVTIHDLIFIRFPDLYKFVNRKIYRNKFQYAANHSDLIIAISEQTKKDIVEFLHIDPKKIKVIYQGCDAVYKKKYTPEEFKQTISKFNLPENYILNVGAVEERKNLFNLVKAIEHTDYNLVVVGKANSNYSQEIKQYIAEKGFQGRIQFLKNVQSEELAQIYQLASLFIYPSIFEGFGIPIIEALYSRTPVITSKESCFSEAGGPHSIYIDPHDYKSIETAIHTVLENKDQQETMVQEGFQYAQRFNDDVIAKNLYEAYNTVLT